ncbi:kojibiose phosphorylase [Paenarthrobacter nicotinovorans]|nr:kojibiose phosphorylase [Paenarthrobacter nicotinovorans]
MLAMFLQWQDFTAEEKQRAFDFYDPITTGDSTLSACVQGIMAAEVGYGDVALQHFTEALFIDLDNSHGNTIDGVHIASTGGIWSSLVCGFAGMRDQGEVLRFDPRLPVKWDGLSFRLKVQGRLLAVELEQGSIALTLVPGPDYSEEPLQVKVRDYDVTVGTAIVQVPLEDVPVPPPSIFPSVFPTAGLPIMG